MKKRKQLTATQRNINKINSNIMAIAKTFGVNSKAYQDAVVKLHTTMQFDKNGKPMYLDTYDKNGVIQIRNTAENRRNMHQSIRKIANSRKSVNILKRKYPKPNLGGNGVGNAPESENDFYKWYSEISANFDDLYDEIYNHLAPATEMLEISFDMGTAFKSETYRLSKWREVFDKLISDTKAAAEFARVFGYGVDVETGENMTRTNDDYEPRFGFDNPDFFDFD